VVRAFSYFSHLANIAEDQHHNRRRRAHLLAGSATQSGSVPHALSRLDDAGVSGAAIREFFNGALVSPVLTAHPTEVQRKSILDAEHEIARLLAERDRALTPRERTRNSELLHAQVATLWQTRMLRYTKLTVADEIENALSYYRITFLRELPALFDDMEVELSAQFPQLQKKGSALKLPPFVQMGSWIGGDRDGNPNVNAATMQHALTRQSTTILDFYLQEVHSLGAELSISTLLVGVSPELQALADASPDLSAHRNDEPYRRALIYDYARLAATARALGASNILRKEVGHADPYESAIAFTLDLQTIADSLSADVQIKKTISVLILDGRSGQVRSTSDGIINIDASPMVRPDGKIYLRLTVEYRPEISAQQAQQTGASRVSFFNQSLALLVSDGRSLIAAQAADPHGDRKLSIEVPASVVK